MSARSKGGLIIAMKCSSSKGGVTTATWRDHLYGSAENPREEDNEEDDGARVVSNRPLAVLLADKDGQFCVGPKEKLTYV